MCQALYQVFCTLYLIELSQPFSAGGPLLFPVKVWGWGSEVASPGSTDRKRGSWDSMPALPPCRDLYHTMRINKSKDYNVSLETLGRKHRVGSQPWPSTPWRVFKRLVPGPAPEILIVLGDGPDMWLPVKAPQSILMCSQGWEPLSYNLQFNWDLGSLKGLRQRLIFLHQAKILNAVLHFREKNFRKCKEKKGMKEKSQGIAFKHSRSAVNWRRPRTGKGTRFLPHFRDLGGWITSFKHQFSSSTCRGCHDAIHGTAKWSSFWLLGIKQWMLPLQSNRRILHHHPLPLKMTPSTSHQLVSSRGHGNEWADQLGACGRPCLGRKPGWKDHTPHVS